MESITTMKSVWTSPETSSIREKLRGSLSALSFQKRRAMLKTRLDGHVDLATFHHAVDRIKIANCNQIGVNRIRACRLISMSFVTSFSFSCSAPIKSSQVPIYTQTQNSPLWCECLVRVVCAARRRQIEPPLVQGSSHLHRPCAMSSQT